MYTMLSVQLAHDVRGPRLHTYGRGREFEDTEIGRHETPDNVDATTHSQARATAQRQARMERETLGDTSMGELTTARRH